VAPNICGEWALGSVRGVHFLIPISLFADAIILTICCEIWNYASGSRQDYLLTGSFTNGSKLQVRFGVQFGPGTWALQRVFTQHTVFKSQNFLQEFSIWVLIVLQHNLYGKYAAWCPLSSSVFQLAIRPIVVQSWWIPGNFGMIFGLIPLRLNEYWSDRNQRMDNKTGYQSAHIIYRSCCDTMRILILNWIQRCKTHEIEPWSGLNPSLNPAGTPVFQVTTRTTARQPGTVANTTPIGQYYTAARVQSTQKTDFTLSQL
jgi:hypothetical protein